MNARIWRPALWVGLLSLTGCGGGSGGGGSTPAPPPPPPPPATYSLSATVTGLDGTVVLQNNGGSDVSVTANGTVTFGTGLAAGTAYAITVATQPANPAQDCAVTSGSGVLNSNVDVAISCADIPLALSSSAPANDATGVDFDAIPSMTFSRMLSAATVTPATVTLASMAGSEDVSLTVATDTLTAGHALPLRPLTNYTLTASTALRGAASEAPSAAIAVKFTTRDATWRTAQDVESGNNGFTRNPHVAVDTQGRQLLIWEQNDGTRYRLRASLGVNGLFDAPANMDGGNFSVSDSTMAMNANGDATIVWTQSDGVRQSIRGLRHSASGWFLLQFLEQSDLGDAEEPQVVIDADARGLVVFAMSDGTRKDLYARHFEANAYGQLQSVESDSAGDAMDAQVALGPGAIAHVIWSQSDGTQTNIWENTVPLGGVPGIRLAVESAPGNASQPRIAVDAAGNVFAVWRQVTAGVTSLYGNRRSTNGAWGAPVLLETSAGSVSRPSLAVDSSGNALVVWEQLTTARTNIWANRYDVTSGWGTAALLEYDDGGDAFSPVAAFDSSGNGMVVWTQSNGAHNDHFAVRLTPSGGFSAPADIYPALNASPGPINFSFGPRGNGLATYPFNDSDDNVVAVKSFE